MTGWPNLFPYTFFGRTMTDAWSAWQYVTWLLAAGWMMEEQSSSLMVFQAVDAALGWTRSALFKCSWIEDWSSTLFWHWHQNELEWIRSGVGKIWCQTHKEQRNAAVQWTTKKSVRRISLRHLPCACGVYMSARNEFFKPDGFSIQLVLENIW